MIDWWWLIPVGVVFFSIGVPSGWVLCALVTHADTGTPAPPDGEEET